MAKKITTWDLAWASKSEFYETKAKPHIKSARILADKSIFLSHSHKDRQLALGLARYLGRIGVDLYIDWQDQDLPRITSRETADSIKQRIQQSDLLLMLATQNAVGSRWVPWEIGIGDLSLGVSKVLIVPVADSRGQFYGSEYLDLYPRIELDDEQISLRVLEPGFEYVSKGLGEWIRMAS